MPTAPVSTAGCSRAPGMQPDWSLSQAFGERSFHGIPFTLGEPDRPNVILLSEGARPGTCGSTLIRSTRRISSSCTPSRTGRCPSRPDFAPMGPAPLAGRNDGNELGRRVSDYILDYGDGEQAETPILRRFAIQQRHITWGPSPFAAIPALGPAVFTSAPRTSCSVASRRTPTAGPRRATTPAAPSTPRTSGSTPCPTPIRRNRSTPSSCAVARSAPSSTASRPRPSPTIRCGRVCAASCG